MIIMNLELDNFMGFEDFKINFSYPKKIVNSSIEEEFLVDKPNFRYKKVNILMGSNASGKTSIGRAIMIIFNFLKDQGVDRLINIIRDKDRAAKFSIDFLVDSKNLYRVNFEIMDKKYSIFDTFSCNITKSDSYETCVKKLKKISKTEQIGGEIKPFGDLPSFGWLFSFPDDGSSIAKENDVTDIRILKHILQTLDTNIQDVLISEEVKDSYIIKSKYVDIFVQEGEVVNKNILSSGTRAGIDISHMVSSIFKDSHGFYYCDENFSFINTDIEQAILSIMISLLHPYSQLFFTTHNLDLLEMDLPIHSFTFLRKCQNIEVVYSSKTIKKNDVSLKNKVKNDVFNISPDTSKIFELEDILLYEN